MAVSQFFHPLPSFNAFGFDFFFTLNEIFLMKS